MADDRRRGGRGAPLPVGDGASGDDAGPVIALRGVSVVFDGRAVVDDLDWVVSQGQHVVLLGPNGAGKTTVLRLVAGFQHPMRGTVDVLGARIGQVDVRVLRRGIGIVSDGLGDLVERRSPLRRLVGAALHGMTTAFGARLGTDDLARADGALARVGIDHLGDRRGTEVSEGEWKRALLARALVTDPALLLLDEPGNGLDLAERERFLADLERTLTGDDAPTAVLVTHHLEQVPGAITHALLLRDGAAVASGPVAEAITDEHVSTTFGVPLEVVRVRGRLTAVPTTPIGPR